ncbi:hypothetical protein IWQ60_002322 [Tieghemiomyces parasiticus]|uniref:Ras GEF n=1 Tax=Tieghemiomyces parasiticus TaxID=78921 RepID=A0A9W8AF26_9FUNG|nr:hypothetical protein IWQ60_002322 [Tieghemiomyces parasiticus]
MPELTRDPEAATSTTPPETPSKNSQSWTLFLRELNRVIAEFDGFRKQDCVLLWADSLTDIIRRLLKASNLLYASSDLLKNSEFRRERQRAVSSLARLVYLSKLAAFPFPPNNIEHRTRKQALVLIQHVQYLVLMLDTHNIEFDSAIPTEADDAQFPDYFGMCKPLPAVTGDPEASPAPAPGAATLIKQAQLFKKSFVYLDRDDFVQIVDYLSGHIVKTVASLLTWTMKEQERQDIPSSDLLRTLGWTGQVLCLIESLVAPPGVTVPARSGSSETRPATSFLTPEKAKLYASFEELYRSALACCQAPAGDHHTRLMNAVIGLLQASEEACMGLKAALSDEDTFKALTASFQYLLALSTTLRHTSLHEMKARLNIFYQQYAKAGVAPRVGVASEHLPAASTTLPTPPQQEAAPIHTADVSFPTKGRSNSFLGDPSGGEDAPGRKGSFTTFALPFIRRMRSRPDLITHPEGGHSLSAKKRPDPVITSGHGVLPSPESPLPSQDHWLLKQYSVSNTSAFAPPPTPPLPEVRRMRSDAGFPSHLVPSGVSTTTSHRPLALDNRMSRQRSLDALSCLPSIPGDGSSASPISPGKPWFMHYEYGPEELTINDQGLIITGTMEALVERLTLHDCSVDSEYISTFLLTFRSFCPPARFLDILLHRFHLPAPERLTADELPLWQQQKLTPIRLRVVNVVKTWLESYFFDDEDAGVLSSLGQFVDGPLRAVMAASAGRLLQLVDAKRTTLVAAEGNAPARLSKSKSIDRMLAAAYASLPDTPPPAPRVPRAILGALVEKHPISVFEIEPLEIARQLTLMDSALFGALRPHELIGQEFSKKDLGVATNVRAMTARSNRITAWVVVSVLAEPELKRRTTVLKFFLRVADALLTLNNFNTLMAIVSGLNFSAVSRLQQTWKSLAAKYGTQMRALDALTDPDRNFAAYRCRLRNQSPPCLPFLGVYLTDLTFTDDSNQTFRRQSSVDRLTVWSQRSTEMAASHDSGTAGPTDTDRSSLSSISTDPSASEEPKALVNFHKYFQTVRIIKEIQHFQVPYNLKDVPELQRYLVNEFDLCYTQFDDDVLYDRSLVLEPRKNCLKPLLSSSSLNSGATTAAGMGTSTSFLTQFNTAAANHGGSGPPHGSLSSGLQRNTLDIARSQSTLNLQDLAKRTQHLPSPAPTPTLASSQSTSSFAELSPPSIFQAHSKRSTTGGIGGSTSVVSNRGLAFGFM